MAARSQRSAGSRSAGPLTIGKGGSPPVSFGRDREEELVDHAVSQERAVQRRPALAHDRCGCRARRGAVRAPARSEPGPPRRPGSTSPRRRSRRVSSSWRGRRSATRDAGSCSSGTSSTVKASAPLTITASGFGSSPSLLPAGGELLRLDQAVRSPRWSAVRAPHMIGVRLGAQPVEQLAVGAVRRSARSCPRSSRAHRPWRSCSAPT